MAKNRIAIEEEKLRLHKWGIPAAHAFLWTIGMFITTDLWDVLSGWFGPDSDSLMAFSLGTIIVIFFGEIIFSFLDIILEQEIKTINVTFCYFLALLVTVLAAIVMLMYFGCYFLPSCPISGKILIGLLIVVSAFAKGMEIWLQNNWERYTVDVPVMNQMNELSYTIK